MPTAAALLKDLLARFPARPDAFQLLVNPDCALHDPRAKTPETPARLNACLRGLLALPQGANVAVAQPAPAHWRDLSGVHEAGYLHALESALLARRPQFMSPDCPLDDGSLEAILAAAGLALALGDTLAAGGAGLALTRPPGHHAGPARAEGFCFLNHVALAIHRLRQSRPGARVAVVDIDLHHGNGTQACLRNLPDTFFMSLHADPLVLYPGSGFAHENQDGPCIVRDFPLPMGTTGATWLATLKRGLAEADAFAPDVVLVSLGLDGHREDPFGFFALEDGDFVAAMRELRLLAKRRAQGILGVVLEGGYSLGVLERGMAGVVGECAEKCTAE